MPTESNKLRDARAFLMQFETVMDRPEGIIHLSKALPILDDILAESESEQERQVALRLLSAYAEKVEERIKASILNEQLNDWETVMHWRDVYEEINSYDFPISKSIGETISKLFDRRMQKEVEFMSHAERMRFVKRVLSDTNK